MAKKNWIKGAIKKKGALRESLGIKKGHIIPATVISSEIEELQSKAEKGKLSEPARLKLRRLVLAKTLRKFKK